MDYSEFSCPWIQKEELWRIVEDFSNQYWPEKNIPVDMERIVEGELGLNIQPKRSLSDQLDMDAFLRLDLTGVLVDYDRYMNDRFQNRLRFSLAHEVGHFVLHRQMFKKISFRTPQEWKSFILDLPENEYRSFEWQANEFAGRLLVPRDELSLRVEEIKEKLQEKQLAAFLRNDPDAVLKRISPSLCKPFGVSEDVIETRVKREMLWPPDL